MKSVKSSFFFFLDCIPFVGDVNSHCYINSEELVF